MNRNRIAYIIGVFVVIGFGLASRHLPGLIPPLVAKYTGDALWSVMVFVGCGVVLPRASTRRLAVLAWGISCLVEFSQCYHAPWIDAIRHTRLGNLALGFTFSWFDLLAYTAGVMLAAGLEALGNRAGWRALRGSGGLGT